MVTLPVVSKRKGKIFWKPKVEPQFFWVQDNCWHFVLCGCGVDIECLWAHGYNTLKYTTLKHPYYTLSRIDETVSWLFLISPVILEGAWCIFLVHDELKNPRLPQNHRVVIKRPLGPNALWSLRFLVVSPPRNLNSRSGWKTLAPSNRKLLGFWGRLDGGPTEKF